MFKDKIKGFMDKFKVEDEFNEAYYEEDGSDYGFDEVRTASTDTLSYDDIEYATPGYAGTGGKEMSFDTVDSDSVTDGEEKGFSFAKKQVRPRGRTVSSGEKVPTINTVKPKVVEDWRVICDYLLRNQVAIINLEGTEAGLPQRITDALSGACYALDAKFRYINPYIMIVAPENVELKGAVMKSLNDTVNEMTTSTDSYGYENLDDIY
ncbi:MAG: cell division protein SepF [Eubacteriales bacterium]|nr:cell division protein SepF [Eubacteriales bacterium]